AVLRGRVFGMDQQHACLDHAELLPQLLVCPLQLTHRLLKVRAPARRRLQPLRVDGYLVLEPVELRLVALKLLLLQRVHKEGDATLQHLAPRVCHLPRALPPPPASPLLITWREAAHLLPQHPQGTDSMRP
ncbi:hypothetical protein TraAM80_10036, partial [Trypanosoma rangeli]